ncbi:MscS Mechanosensitive ion channel [Fulvivirga imtechensis AK7]|uniref:MscS Mechanosensitive ion channel n=1 Tax=Fulvivirga imtechensis AK7 TaxID=1237149 RepID=L8JKR7_9BACT|nr:mechanosensitive ion channel domain-containing protein [Fulvivirga imtechensis]ELR69385.1 MscS Mechanosensitive ion channel [Fulvivirga imtechensis AK7]
MRKQRPYYNSDKDKERIEVDRHRRARFRDTKYRKRLKKTQGGSTIKGAQTRLKQFKQASILAVAMTGFLLLVLTPQDVSFSQEDSLDTAPAESIVEESVLADTIEPLEEEFSKAAKNEALNTARNLWEGFYANLPKLLVAIVTLLLAWIIVRLVKALLKKILHRWKDIDAIITLVGISLWIIAIGVAVSAVAGDIRALLGSLGLVGLALSWSLQTPIESFTGWLQNSFQRYYRVGDRISVGEVFGDVYKIDFLTTTVWEIGAPYRQGFVQAEQPTGRLVTFPNNEILSGTVVNLTRDFPYVWDELAIAIANESDVELAIKTINEVASLLLRDYMETPAREYRKILERANLSYEVAEKPEVYISANESWTDIIVRYLVGARERRRWKSSLTLNVLKELNKEVYKNKIIAVYPRQQIQVVDHAGTPVDFRTKTDH